MARSRAHASNLVTLSAHDLATSAVRISGHYKDRSWQSRWNRRAKNLANWNAYWARMDWSHKLPWQTQQTIAEFGISIEQSVGTLERGLTDTEDWLTVDPVGIGDPAIDPDTIGALLKYYLTRLWIPGNLPETSYNIANLIGDGVKRGLLESVITMKVVGRLDTKYQYRLEHSKPQVGPHGRRESVALYDVSKPGIPSVVKDVVDQFRLQVEIIPWEDYFPDPSPLNKYVLHEVTVNLADLGANPDYDPDVVDQIRSTAAATYADMYKRTTQDVVFVPHDEDEVRVQEFWGDLIDPTTGDVLATNAFWTICNGQCLRRPTPNPFWHGKRPIISAPLLRVPNSTVHKALADDAVDSWQFLSELLSLMFDGALASVWGKFQMRTDYVENSDDFQEGIPQAATFLLKPGTPTGLKVVESIDGAGVMPSYAVQMFDLAMRQFQTAMATNDLKLGQQPPKEATATSIVEAMQSAGSLFESIAARVEDTLLEPLFELCWMTILQYESEEKFIEPELVQILGPERVLALTQMSPEERFVVLSQSAKFKCRGLRGVAARSRVMTKLGNLVQLFQTSPELAQAYAQKYSMSRLAEQLIRNSGVDPTTLEKTQDEKDTEEAQQMVQDTLPPPQPTPQAAGGPVTPGGPAPPGGSAAPTPGNGGSPPAMLDAGQDQLTSGPGGMASKTPQGNVPGTGQGT